jgi:hypothetical protein
VERRNSETVTNPKIFIIFSASDVPTNLLIYCSGALYHPVHNEARNVMRIIKACLTHITVQREPFTYQIHTKSIHNTLYEYVASLIQLT